MNTEDVLEGPLNPPSHSSDPDNTELEYFSSLKDTIVARRVACREALIAGMVNDTIKFLNEYKTTVYPHARFFFIPGFVTPKEGPSEMMELREYPSRAKFVRSKVVDEAKLFWMQPDLAKRIAALLKTALESRVGTFAKMGREKGVVVTVDAEKLEPGSGHSGNGCVVFVNVEMKDME